MWVRRRQEAVLGLASGHWWQGYMCEWSVGDRAALVGAGGKSWKGDP